MPRRPHARSHRLRRGRSSETGRSYLVTTVVRGRRPLQGDWDAAAACARALHAAPADAAISPLAWVVMPDPVHWLFALDRGSLDQVMQRFKSRSARGDNTAMRRQGSVWRAGHHDHAVRSEASVRALTRYVVANPIRSGLTAAVGSHRIWDAVWL